MSVEKQEFIKTFGPSESLTDDVVSKLQTLKSIFNLSTEDIYVHWETYNVNEVETDLELSPAILDDFQQYLQKHLTSSNQRLTPSLKRSKDLNSSAIKRKPLLPINSSSPISELQTPQLKNRKLNETPYKTPNLKFESSPAHFETANNSFDSKSPLEHHQQMHQTSSPSRIINKDSNTVLETLQNPNLLPVAEIDNDFSTSKVQIATNFDASKYKFRTMSMKLLESADMLDDQIDQITQIYQEHHKDDDINFANPCLSSQFSIHCCGRIVPDSPLYDKLFLQDLNAKSLYLETSRLGGIGQRVPLELSSLKEFSLFPGQIACLKGKNPTGKMFIVEEVLQLPELGAPVTSEDELQDYKLMIGDSGLKFVMASGPFSNQTTLNYEKFEGFIERINSTIKPDVVILFGPFLDLNNKAVMEGNIQLPNEKNQPTNLDEVFKKALTPTLKKINPKIQVILIPSLKDAISKHCSYPQDGFDRKQFGLPKNFKVFPNPAGFAINEVLFGTSNLDVFKDLKDVIKLNNNPDNGTSPKVFTNRFERIANHIFDQRRYYPNFPGSINRKPPISKSEADHLKAQYDGSMAEEYIETKVGGSCLETSYMGLAELGDSLPDILIIPSELKYFAKVIKNVIVVNPGAFIRPNRDASKEDGTYVVMNCKGPDPQDEENVEKVNEDLNLYYHNVFKRSKIDIYKS